uniref:Pyrroline-5-carboxylate reductase n=1 Tax=Panagrolaimus sp. ES5 TaxID=591445 RepID=A0AC34FFX9_9BILA
MNDEGELMESNLLTHLDSLCLPSHRRMLVFGGGKMALAIVEGIVKAGLLLKENIFISTRTEASGKIWKDRNYPHVFTNNAFLCEACWSPDPQFWIVLIAVKPQTRFTLFDQLRDDMSFDRITRSFADGQMLVISVLAGVDTATIRLEYTQHLFYNGPILRVTPNVACAIGSGTSLICSDNLTPRKFVDIGIELFQAVGVVKEVPEGLFDAASAVAGSGPAFIFLIIEALTDGGVAAGLSRELATELASSMVRGSADLIISTGSEPAKLRGDVCSPAGTTICGVRELEKGNVRSSFIEAILSTAARSKQLR